MNRVNLKLNFDDNFFFIGESLFYIVEKVKSSSHLRWNQSILQLEGGERKEN
jgi:hypothetical protein